MEITTTVEADFLVIGGGVGGMQAAIEAAALGMRTVVAEKADTRHSGCAGNGNDHFACYIPEYHGKNFEFVLREIAGTIESDQWQDLSMLRVWLERSFEIVKKWEAWGINMRPSGEWCFEGHTYPGQKNYYLKIKGDNIKSALTKKALESGVTIMNRVAVTDVLTNDRGEACGALGLDISGEVPKAIVFKAPAVLIATGLISRMYPSVNPAFMFNTSSCPAVTGGGHAMAYRAGARLVNMDIPAIYVGPRYFARGGRGSWIGLTSDIDGNPIGPYMDVPSREYGDVLVDVWPEVFRDKYHDGTGPVYMNCTRTSDADLEYMLENFPSEGLDSVVDYMEQYHVDLKKQMIEFSSYNNDLCARGIEISENAMTSVPGLYATGNAVGNTRGSSTAAAVFGMVAAESAAANKARQDAAGSAGTHCGFDAAGGAAKSALDADGQQAALTAATQTYIKERLAFFDAIMARGAGGARWVEANGTLQSIMRDYAGYDVRSETILRAGLTYLEQLWERSVAELGAQNSHELCRTLEVLEMIEVARIVFITARNRKESRGLFKRLDYPYENHQLSHKYQTVEKKDGRVILDFRERH